MTGSVAPALVTPEESRRTERLLWWLALAGAVTSVVVGALMVFWPEATLYIGAVLFGLWLIVHGIVNVARAIISTVGDGPGMRALEAVIGIVFIGAGIVCLRHLVLSIVAVATVIGLMWVIGGIVRIASAFTPRYSGAARAAVAVFGTITVAGGLIVLVWPKMTLLAVVVFTGVWMIVMGLVQLVVVIRLRAAV